ncbi:MAG: cell division protein FtsZ [Gammaproteobacteria bacterium]|nr:MAG: cell division protein FtsZ [Gammaproteobacteria bacterium]
MNDNIRFQPVGPENPKAVIKVISAGGGGGNAVKFMQDEPLDNIQDVEFICTNTDVQDLININNIQTLQIGKEKTKGLGAGNIPDVGKQAATEDKEKIAEICRGADMIFLTAGMGGGTGTGALPVIAEEAKKQGALTVAVVTKPYSYEGARRMQNAVLGIKELKKHADSLIVISNDKLEETAGDDLDFEDAFKLANNVLRDAVLGISRLITTKGVVNLDFADIKTVMSAKGDAMMGTGHARGEDRAQKAVEMALNCPLLDDINIKGAQGILINVMGAKIKNSELRLISETITKGAGADAHIINGITRDLNAGDELSVTFVATGLSSGNKPMLKIETATNDKNSIPDFNPNHVSDSAKQEFNEELYDIPAYVRKQVH